jgi:hypothetical protein
MSHSAESLRVGEQLPAARVAFTRSQVDRFLEVVDDGPTREAVAVAPQVPPALALAACLRFLMDLIGLPPGTVHTAQDWRVLARIPVDEPLTCQPAVTRVANRRGMRLLSIELSLRAATAELAQGTMSLVLPDAPSADQGASA